MYILDNDNKSLIKAEECSFKSLNLKERQDLQEWIAKEPSSLGEPLLIIQKEFANWDKTKERLDLLALDEKGNLVIIENKLDDSGKDVTWQAIKYASYCRSLSKDDIVSIFQKYLGPNKSALEELSEFFHGRDIEDIKLNDNYQRIILVAGKFQEEVLSSVLWLREYNVRISCIKVTPFKFGNQVMVDFDQIIPQRDLEDYQIKIASKELEETAESEATQIRYGRRQRFWQEFIDYCKSHQGLFAGSTPVTDNWISKSVSSIPGGTINVIINKDNCRAELYLNTGEQVTNKAIYDKLFTIKDELNAQIPGMEWQRMDDKVTCRVRLDKPFSYLNPDDKLQIFDFFIKTGQQMMDMFQKAGTKLKLK